MRALNLCIMLIICCFISACDTVTSNTRSDMRAAHFKKLENDASLGNVIAQKAIAKMYTLGNYVGKDDNKAFLYYSKAADLGDAESQAVLAGMYRYGIGTSKDLKHAIDLYMESAKNGYAHANAILGYIYLHGEGVVQDYKTAIRFFTLASDAEDSYGLWALGGLYEQGTGVAKNASAAIKLYKRAADTGDATAQRNLAQMYYVGELVSKNFNEAFRLFSLSADKGDIYSALTLGDMYYLGQGVKKNLDEAACWYKKIAEQGCSPSQIAFLYDGQRHHAFLQPQISWFPERRSTEVQYLWTIVDGVKSQSIDTDALLKRLNTNQVYDAQYTAKIIAPILYNEIEKQADLSCLRCHSVDGTEKIGPTFNCMYGSISTTNKSVLVDDAYIIAKIKEPGLNSRREDSNKSLRELTMFTLQSESDITNVVLPFLHALGHKSKI